MHILIGYCARNCFAGICFDSVQAKRRENSGSISIKGDYRSDYPSQIGDMWTIDNQYGVLCGLWMYKRLYERLLKEFFNFPLGFIML